MSIYSAKLCATSVTSGSSVDLFTAPAGKVTVIRSIQLGCFSSGASQILLTSSDGTFVASGETSTELTVLEISTRRVVDAGETISGQAPAGEWTVTISGYLLD
jgi:hypothetical protein